MHVPLRRAEVGVASKLLNRLRWSTPDRQPRTERVAKDVNSSGVLQIRPALRFSHPIPDDRSIEPLVAIAMQNSSVPQLAVGLEQRSQPFGHRHSSISSTLRYSDKTTPVGALNVDGATAEVNIAPLERDYFSATEASISPEQDNGQDPPINFLGSLNEPFVL